MPLPTPIGAIRSPGLLWCEGPHDFAFLRRMLGYLGNTEQVVRVEVFGGKDQLPDYLTTLSLRPGFEVLKVLAIVRDADEDAGAAFASVTDHVERSGLIAPDKHRQFISAESTDSRSRSVGIFIAPDGTAPGALESLYLQSLGEGPVVDCVREFMQCVGPELRHTRVAQFAKAEFHAWLATCPEPGILPGQAMDANFIDRTNPAFGAIRDFLSDLIAAARTPEAPSA
jgi:hypothetical protein